MHSRQSKRSLDVGLEHCAVLLYGALLALLGFAA